MYPHDGAFPEPDCTTECTGYFGWGRARGFNCANYADTGQFASGAGCITLGDETLVIAEFFKFIEQLVIIAAVVLQRHRRLIWKFVGWNKVFAAQGNRVHIDFAGGNINGAFKCITCFGATSTAIGIDWCGVGDRAPHFTIHPGHLVQACHQSEIKCGWDERCES